MGKAGCKEHWGRIACKLEAIAIGLEAIATRVEAIACREDLNGFHRGRIQPVQLAAQEVMTLTSRTLRRK